MRLATAGVMLGGVIACHETIELPTPPNVGNGTTVFLQGDEASWSPHDEDGKFNDITLSLDPDAPLVALRYDCSSELLELPAPLTLLTMPADEAPMLANESFIWEGGPQWEKLADDNVLADDLMKRLNWEAPELCATRAGRADYTTPPIPPNSLQVLSAFFSLNDGSHAFLANPAGPAFTVDHEGRVETIAVPGAVAAGYGGESGQFFILTHDGEVFRGNQTFEFTRLASGAPVVASSTQADAYEANRLIGAPNGDDLMVVTSTGVFILGASGSWDHIVAPSWGTDLFGARWLAPGEFVVFGFDGTNKVFHLRTDGSVITSWTLDGYPARFHSSGGRLFLSTIGIIGGQFRRLGSTYELKDGQWLELFDGSADAIPVGLTESGDVLLAQLRFGFSSFTRFGVFHDAIESRCFEQEVEKQQGGLLRDSAPLASGIDLFFTQSTGGAGQPAPVVTLRTQMIPQRACGRDPPEDE